MNAKHFGGPAVFNAIEALSLSDDEVTVKVSTANFDPGVYMMIKDADPNGPTLLTVDEARELRDWLNRALPETASDK